LFPSFVIDELDPGFLLCRSCGRGARGPVEAEFTDGAGGGGDLGGDLPVAGDQQCSSMSDLCSLGLARGPCCGAAASLAISD
jgi:hypothetical protein